jgi:hypothetical protein
MPELSGVELAIQFKEACPGCRILLPVRRTRLTLFRTHGNRDKSSPCLPNRSIHAFCCPMSTSWQVDGRRVLVGGSSSRLGRQLSFCSLGPGASQFSMACAQCTRLRQIYEVAVRRWGQIILSQPTHSSYALTEERDNITSERSVARKRLEFHKRNCSICNRAARPIH